ncbi:MAG TPA: methyltransferase [Afipia sp.]
MSEHRKPFGACAPNALQRAVIAAAHGSDLKHVAFRPWLSRLVNLLGPGPIDAAYQGGSFRLHHRVSDAERGALFNPDDNLPELDFLRAYVPAGGAFVDVGANAGTYAVTLAKHVGASGRVVAIERHPAACARLAFNAQASQLTNLTLVTAVTGDIDSIPKIKPGVDNPAASRRLLTILNDNAITHVDALRIAIKGREDRVLTPFFRDAPQILWPTAVAVAHLRRNAWLNDCIEDMTARGYGIAGKTRSNTLLVRS